MPPHQTTCKVVVKYLCPCCHSPVKVYSELETISCSICDSSYSVTLGIPDFRLDHKDWIIADRQQALRLTKHYFDRNFEELVRIRFSNGSNIPAEIFEYHLAHEMNYSVKGAIRRHRVIQLLGQKNYDHLPKKICLDVGCGTGSSLVGFARDFEFGLGVDVLIQDLILGKKYAEEHGLGNIQYVCAFGESLPFESDTFDLVNATDTIEHLDGTQELFLQEIRRVLKCGGVFCFNSPNRFNLFTPEPHVRIWGLGFLPRCWMNAVCMKIKRVEYRGKRLLSYFELKRLLRKTFRKSFRMEGLIVDPHQAKESFIGKIFSLFPWSLKFFNTIFRYLLTNYQVVAFKESSH